MAAASRELDPDEEWGQWFQMKQQNGYVFIDKDEWKQRLDDAAKDGYAEGRSDEREESAGLLAALIDVTDRLAWLNSDEDGHIMALTDRARAAIAAAKGES